MTEDQVSEDLTELEQRLLAMGNTVESLLADSVIGLIERTPGVTRQLRAEDYRAHDSWMEIDKLSVDLIASGRLEPEQVALALAASRIAAALKRIADKGLSIAVRATEAGLTKLAPRVSVEPLPQMAGLAQTMLGDCIEACINRDAEEASTLHMVFREMASMEDEMLAGLAESIDSRLISAGTGLHLAAIADRLKRIGEQVLEIANQIAHLYAE